LPLPKARGATVNGTARVSGGSGETDSLENDVLDQSYNISLIQPLAPALRFTLAYRYNSFRLTPEGFDTIKRDSSEPWIELVYRRSTFSTRLSFQKLRNRGTNPTDNLDVKAFIAQASWTPHRGPRSTLRYREDHNFADIAIFGRDVKSRTLDFNLNYGEGPWSTIYAFRTTRTENLENLYELEQIKHELRGTYTDRYWDDRFGLSIDGWISRVEQTERVADGTQLAEPLTIQQGLYEVDTSPDVSTLPPAPAGLTDGDFVTPVQPPIEIGGANTFRNIGADLGVTLRATRIEITVDTPSDPGVPWDVYQSVDNINWFPIVGVVSSFDAAFLRYTLVFPETTNRYFKAVNVGPNVSPTVRVTELRVLLDVQGFARPEGANTAYRADLMASLTPNRVVHATFGLGLGNDKNIAGGRVSRARQEVYYLATVDFRLRDDLIFRLNYRFDDGEEDLEPVLRRRVVIYGVDLDWKPLPTVDSILSVIRREESDSSVLIRRSDTVRLRVMTALLPDLKLTSELVRNDTEDMFFGFLQESLRWEERLEARPAPRWRLDGGMSVTWYDSTAPTLVRRRSFLDVRTTWAATHYLTLLGNWRVTQDDSQDNILQRYSISWTPGPKLYLGFTYQDNETIDVRRQVSTNANLNYRLNRSFRLFSDLTRSTLEAFNLAESTTNSFRVGFYLFF